MNICENISTNFLSSFRAYIASIIHADLNNILNVSIYETTIYEMYIRTYYNYTIGIYALLILWRHNVTTYTRSTTLGPQTITRNVIVSLIISVNTFQQALFWNLESGSSRAVFIMRFYFFLLKTDFHSFSKIKKLQGKFSDNLG